MDEGEEHTRFVHLSRVHKKDYHYYRGTETVWNEHTRLSPKFHQYSMNSHKFKRWGPKDLKKIENEEKEQQYQNLLTTVTQSKQENASRMQSRKAEREVVRKSSFYVLPISLQIQFKSKQELTKETEEQLR